MANATWIDSAETEVTTLGTTVNATKPAGVVAFDLMVMYHVTSGNVTHSITAAGWTTHWQSVQVAGGCTTSCYSLLAGGGEPGTYEVNSNVNGHHAVIISQFRNVNRTTPIDVIANAVNAVSSVSVVAPDITTTEPNVLMYALGAGSTFGNDISNFTFPGGMTEQAESNTTITGQRTALDESSNAFAVSFVGAGASLDAGSNPDVGSTASLSLSGASTTYVSVPSSTAFDFGTGDFTIDLYCDIDSNRFAFLVGRQNFNSSARWGLVSDASGNLEFWHSFNQRISSTTNMATEGWAHVAVSRNSGSTRIYLNGTQVGSTGTSMNITAGSQALHVGKDPEQATRTIDGHMDAVRIIKGTGLYPSGTPFTPPSTPLTAVAGTELLLNFDTPILPFGVKAAGGTELRAVAGATGTRTMTLVLADIAQSGSLGIQSELSPTIKQIATEVITNINPVNTDPLKLCLPFDEILTEAFTVDESPSVHPIDMTTELPTIRSDPNGFDDKFGGGAVELGAGGDFVRVLLPQPDLNFDGDFTIEFWLFRIAAGAQEDVMGQWPEDASHPSPGTDLGWRIKLFGPQLHFEWTSDGATINTEVAFHDVAFEEWEHLVFENFDGIFTIYSNGIPVYNTASFVPIHRSVEDLLIGKADRYGTGGDGACDCNIDELKIVVGEATYQAPFLAPIASIDCSSVIPPDITWSPGNLGQQDECTRSLFKIDVNGIELVSGTQEFSASGLPNNMTIDAFGNIIGITPTHTPAPNVQNYEFTVTFIVGGVPLLGPNTFSFDVLNVYSNDIFQVQIPALFEGNERIDWRTSLLGLIEFPDIFRPTDPNFGIRVNPDLLVIDGLTDSPLIDFQNALSTYEPASRRFITLLTLEFGTTDNFDVLYYTIEDKGSTVISFENPLNAARELGVLPDPIEPLSIDNIRDKLIAAIGYDSLFNAEVLPSFLTVHVPAVIAAYVTKGKGQALVDKFNNDAVHQIFKGRIITVDRLDITRCSTFWDENGESRIVLKFDDI